MEAITKIARQAGSLTLMHSGGYAPKPQNSERKDGGIANTED